ncbi:MULTISPECIES: hypothetical protein [Streptomyces]|uniref:hypothetical protein n=1 Tax=Streptomyces TaxID=1883 RepID=UPI00367B3C4C
MPDALRSLDDMLANTDGLTGAEVDRLRCEKVLGTTAIILHQQGDPKATELAAMLAELVTLDLDYQGEDWDVHYYDAYLEVEPHLVAQFTPEILERIEDVMRDATRKDPFGIKNLAVRPILPKVGIDWRKQLQVANGPRPTNQARRVRVEPQHPTEDGLHFTNEWEHGVYQVLKEQQGKLPDNDTIGIMPLGALRVRKHTFEPDFLITYRGRVGVIEIDGPHHKGRRSDDHSRERLLRNAGVKQIDRIDVRDVSTKQDVEKFVTDFLKHLAG